MACLGNGAMTGGAERCRRDTERRVEAAMNRRSSIQPRPLNPRGYVSQFQKIFDLTGAGRLPALANRISPTFLSSSSVSHPKIPLSFEYRRSKNDFPLASSTLSSATEYTVGLTGRPMLFLDVKAVRVPRQVWPSHTRRSTSLCAVSSSRATDPYTNPQ